MIIPLNPIEQTYQRLIASGKDVQKLFSGNPNEQGFRFPSEILAEVYDAYFQNQNYHPHPKGLRVAREAIQNYYLKQNAHVDVENILLTSGTSESFFYLFSLLAQPGDNILTPNPAYPLFDHIADLAKIELRHYSLQGANHWKMDLDDLKRKTDSHTRAIVLVSPNNPTGAVASAEEIRELVSWANQKEIPLICDEVFSEFYFGSENFPRPITIAAPQLVFTLNGISKMFALPALKLSWIAVTGSPAKVASAVDRLETMADTFLSCHIPIQETLPALFSQGQSFLQEYRKEVDQRRRLAFELLQTSTAIRVIEPQGGFYLMGEICKPMNLSEEEFVIRLMEEKQVFVHPGYFYDYEQGIHFVISFLTEPTKLQEGLAALISFVEKR